MVRPDIPANLKECRDCGRQYNDTLGAAGNDTITGGAGDDTYVVNSAGDVAVEKASEGVDTVQSSVTWTLGSYLEHLTLTAASAINGTGNGGNNTITGNDAANVLNGGTGNDILDGGASSDTLIGGQGADTYRFARGGGSDLISNADTDLGADVISAMASPRASSASRGMATFCR
jgi:Ca2+-binding RTX toxin-like protein